MGTASPACPGRPTSPPPPSRSASTSRAALPPQAAAAGQRRPGPPPRRAGQEILMECRSPTPIAVSFLAERTIFPAFASRAGRMARGRAAHQWREVDPKRQYVLKAGDTVSLATPGAAGMATPPRARRRSMRRMSRRAMSRAGADPLMNPNAGDLRAPWPQMRLCGRSAVRPARVSKACRGRGCGPPGRLCARCPRGGKHAPGYPDASAGKLERLRPSKPPQQRPKGLCKPPSGAGHQRRNSDETRSCAGSALGGCA